MILDFDAATLSPRPPGRFVRVLGTFLPGVREVQAQTEPYARRWAESNRAALEQTGPIWVTLGDSMTQGIGASAYDHGWVGQLSARLRARGWQHRVVNLSVTGARVSDVVERQLPALDALLEADEPVALVTCIAGSNDIVSPRWSRGLSDRFTLLLDRLPPRSVVSNLPNPTREATRVSQLVDARAREGDVVVADMRAEGPRSWRGMLAPDTFHPNDRGYAAMAAVVEHAIDRGGLLGPRL